MEIDSTRQFLNSKIQFYTYGKKYPLFNFRNLSIVYLADVFSLSNLTTYLQNIKKKSLYSLVLFNGLIFMTKDFKNKR